MLLTELLDKQSIEQRFLKAASSYGWGDRGREFDLITTQMLKHHPEFRYEGRLYRALRLPSNVVTEASSPTDVLQYIKARNNPDKYQSWSKDVRGAIRYHNLARGGQSKSNVYVIIEQQGTGFDYRPWMNDANSRDVEAWLVNPNYQVFEVLSTPNDTTRLSLFFIENGKEYVKFTPDAFKQLQLALQGNEPETRVNPNLRYKDYLKYLHRDSRKSRVGIDYYDNPTKYPA